MKTDDREAQNDNVFRQIRKTAGLISTKIKE